MTDNVLDGPNVVSAVSSNVVLSSAQLKLIPRHVAIIMDGNGRWAKQRHLPRVAGHRAGVESVRGIVSGSLDLGIEVLTLFAFSSENWSRPKQEVNFLMGLLNTVLRRELRKLNEDNIRLTIIGDRNFLDKRLQQTIHNAESLTANNTSLNLVIALNYGGRWDITQATRKIANLVATGCLLPEDIDEAVIHRHTSLGQLPEPDILIRTSGEMRLSNFLIWQLAYTEMFFVDTYWPDFNQSLYAKVLQDYTKRNRRFGKTDEQVNHI